MYGQNLGGRPDAPSEPIFTKFCMRVGVPDVFLSFEFQKDRLKNVGAVRGRNFASPIDKAHRLYNSLLLPLKPWCEKNFLFSLFRGVVTSAVWTAIQPNKYNAKAFCLYLYVTKLKI